MIGNKYNMLTVLSQEGTNKHQDRLYRCRCDCGNKIVVAGYKVKNGHIKSCGCLKKQIRDITGMIFGRLTAIEFAYRKNDKTYWLCKCECGNECYVPLSSLTNNKTRSCGCLDKEIKVNAIHERMGFVDGTSLVAISPNRKLNKNNQSGIRGVSFDKKRGKWVAQIAFKGKLYYLGRYDDIDEAIRVRKAKEEELFTFH